MAALPNQLAHEFHGHQDAIRAIRFTKSGEYCLTCSADKTVRLWNPHRGLGIKTYKGPGQEVLDATAAHDNGRIICGGRDKVVYLLDVSTGQPIRKYRGHYGAINCVKFNEESSVIITGSYDSTVRVWDCKSRTYDPIQVMEEAKDSITSLFVSNHEILTGSVDGKARRYDIRFGKLFSDTVGQPVTSVSLSRDGLCVLVSSLDNHIRLLDKENGELLNTFKGHSNTEYKIDSSLTHDDSHIVSGSEDGKIYFWDLVEGNVVQTLKQSQSSSCIVYSLSYHPNSACLLSAGSEGPVKVWKRQEDMKEDEDEDD
ncbi:PREDICTED: WD repeat domain-containing protein 83-like [Amphimedon queenslandica]|uniref:WD repeat domain-containing protein 83 n=1 Tax=Amphimedon queenslandica TaxID=400682 RepID=A0A1X7TF19_AMPQE|nr:PREDICTED: WD repeat domain-containing protein 83-like [Amphimedon queenslandica]|eukprot:XP_003390666.1 PREDICTED: WD repeat domain-containing protein 83-like [Amphimedon queenslandica]